MTISEKVAYLKGLSEGLGIDTEKSKEGKLISVIIDILEEVGLSLGDVQSTLEEYGEEIDAISDDLSDVEEVVFEDDEDEDEDDDEDSCCEDDDFFEVKCPNCGAPLVIDQDVLDAGNITCPQCEQKFALDLGDCDCDDGCDCGCSCHDDDADDDGDQE